MNLTTTMQLTAMGEEELVHRVHKVGVKKRSILLLLAKPATVAQLLAKTILPEGEFMGEIGDLLRNGFVAVAGGGAGSAAPAGAAAAASSPPPAMDAAYHIDKDILLSEAKFLLTDFCVDAFGTAAQPLVDAIRACHQEHDFIACFGAVWTATRNSQPARMDALMEVAQQINATA